MATTPCPNCGKPLRPGSRFCGSCGHVISSGTSAGQAAGQPAARPPVAPQPAAVQPQAAAQLSGPPCPHCGKPLRPGAKFCNNCGKSIAPSGPVADSTPPPKPALSRTPAQKTPASGLSASTSPATTLPPVARPVSPAKRPPRTGLRIGIIAVALVLCVAVVGGGTLALDYFGVLPLGIISKATQTEVAVATTAETTLEPPVTTEAPPPTKEQVQEASPTPVTPTLEQVTATEPSPTITPTVKPEETTLRVLLDDHFASTDISTNWNAWGSPRPRVNAKVSPPYLELTSGDRADAAGVTTFVDVPYKPLVLIEFDASLHAVQGLPMKFYWDKKDYVRKNNAPLDGGGGGGNGGGGGVDDGGDDGGACIGPFCPASASAASVAVAADRTTVSKKTALDFFLSTGLNLPSLLDFLGIQAQQTSGVVGIEVGIFKGGIDLSFPSGKICSAPLSGKTQHTYQIRMLSGAAPTDPPQAQLFVDGVALPECAAVFDFDLEGGKISFTGHGMVYSVKVSVP